MTSTAVGPTAPATAPFKQSLLARLIAGFSGPVGLAVKIALLSVVNALAIWAATVLADDGKWRVLVLLGVTTAAIDWIYLSKRTLPLKFLIPGTVFLLALQVIPIGYTTLVAFTNYSTGHITTKPDAIRAIKVVSLEPPANGKSYTMAAAHDSHGKLVLILRDDESKASFAGSSKGLKALPATAVKLDANGKIASAAGYTLVKGAQLFSLDKQLSTLVVPTAGDAGIRAQGFDTAIELRPTLRYDQARDLFVRTSDGATFHDNGKGAFVSANGEELEPGWKTNVGLQNFSRILHDPLIRKPFLRVFLWTFVFAIFSVFFTFAVGLFLAITLDKTGMRLQRTYRSLLVIPYAIPSFLSILVWAGLLNDDFGVVNRILHLNIPWLFDPTWAKVSILLVNTWLGFPYFFLVSLGALQSIPGELIEAARVDGGGRFQIFRRVTFPLLLVAVAPLLIASFAFNFNNFVVIYLLTGGGPPANDNAIAGGTDILISYTFKLAIASGKGQDYGLASAIAIVIFFIVGTISAISFWRSKTLENLA